MEVECYGCGRKYIAGDTGGMRHPKHTGDSGLSRERLLEIIDRLQDERDAFAVRYEEAAEDAY